MGKHLIGIVEKNRQWGLIIGAATAVMGILFTLGLVWSAETNFVFPTQEGSMRQWTPNSGSTHYTQVDDTFSCNGTTDYVFETTVGERSSFGRPLGAIPDGSQITKIEIAPCASRHSSGDGSSEMDVYFRLNGATSTPEGSYALSGTTPVNLATTTFITGLLPAIKSSTSTFEMGVLYAGGDKGARLSRILTRFTYTILAWPSNLVATNISSNENSLSWADNTAIETGYAIERNATGVIGPWTGIATTTANVTSYSDSGLTADQTYYYRVRAFNTGGYSGYSNIDTAVTATTEPASPSGLVGVASSTSAVLSWTDEATNEEGVRVERSVDDVNFLEIGTTGVNATTYTDPTLVSGTYYYRIRSFNSVGNSIYTGSVSVIIP